jgi:hypothetical protein
MPARLDDRWTYDGQRLIRIENRRLAACVVSTMGGKVLSLVDKEADREVLWRSPRVSVRPGPIGANVDDYFAGGWDDAFPTCDPCPNEHGDQLPYMGEIWNLGMRARILAAGPAEASVELVAETPITPALITRTVSLVADEPILRVRTRIENVGHRPFDLCWGSHAALAIRAGMRLEVPAAVGEITDAGEGLLGRAGERYRYPIVDSGGAEPRDIRLVPGPETGAHALHALTELSDGWAAATDPVARRGFGLRFDPELHSCLWQWMSFGGYRGWYHAILEPWTAPQTSLAAAREARTALRLGPGESLEGTVLGIVYANVEAVDSIAPDGSVRERTL